MLEIVIEVDTNDADYIEKTSVISEEDFDKIKPIIKAIKEFKPYETEYTLSWDKTKKNKSTHYNNFPYGEVCRSDMGEKFPNELYPNISEEAWEILYEILPYNECGFHTIKSIKIGPYCKKIELL